MRKKWYICPHCGKRIAAYTETAQSNGVFVQCKQCKKQIEIKIRT